MMYADREEEAIQQRHGSSSSRDKGRGDSRHLSNGNGQRAPASRRYADSPSVSPVSRSRSVSRSISRSPPPTPRRAGTSRKRSASPVNIRGSARRRRASYSSSDDDDDSVQRHRRAAQDSRKRARETLTADDSHEELRRRALLTRNSRSHASPTSPPQSRSSALDDGKPTPLASRIDGRDRDARDSDRRRAERHERRRGRDLLTDADADRLSDTGSRKSARRAYADDDDDGAETYEQRRRRASGRAKGADVDEDVHARRARRDSAPRSRASASHYGSDDEADDARSRSRRGGSTRRDDDYDDPYARRRPSYDRYYAPPPQRGYYDRYAPAPYDRYGPRDPYDYYGRPPRPYTRSPSPPRRRRAESRAKSPDPTDYENRSIFCSQLAARLTQRDLGEFFEDKLGPRTVQDVRIVMDKITQRSKGIGYVELKDESLVEKALALSNTVLFGIPILIQKTDAARNRGAADGETPARPNLPGSDSGVLTNAAGEPIHLDPKSATSAASRLYVGNLHFNLTDDNVRSVFEPFGTIVTVDLHREPATQKSKGFAFVQYLSVENAEKAIQHMNGFELYGRNIRVGHVNAAKMDTPSGSTNGASGAVAGGDDHTGAQATITSSFDEGGGGGLDAGLRADLMQKLARSEQPDAALSNSAEQQRPASIPQATSHGVLIKNMFDPAEETERGWDTDLASDVREECENKYGKVDAIKVDANSQGEVWIRFADLDGSQKAVVGLNGRFFGGRTISAAYVNESILRTMLG